LDRRRSRVVWNLQREILNELLVGMRTTRVNESDSKFLRWYVVRKSNVVYGYLWWDVEPVVKLIVSVANTLIPLPLGHHPQD